MLFSFTIVIAEWKFIERLQNLAMNYFNFISFTDFAANFNQWVVKLIRLFFSFFVINVNFHLIYQLLNRDRRPLF
jgi:hypothetical protein